MILVELELNNVTQTITWSQKLRNWRLSQKLKLLGYGEFNHLTNILTLPLTCRLRLPLNEWGPTREIFNFLNGR